MSISLRSYIRSQDFDRVGDFLDDTYVYGTRPGSWRRSRWEYAHFHPGLDESALNKIGIWEDDGAIVGVVDYEGVVGNAFFQIRSSYESLKPEMLRYAEAPPPGEG